MGVHLGPFADAWAVRDAGRWDEHCRERCREWGHDCRRWAWEAWRWPAEASELSQQRRDVQQQAAHQVVADGLGAESAATDGKRAVRAQAQQDGERQQVQKVSLLEEQRKEEQQGPLVERQVSWVQQRVRVGPVCRPEQGPRERGRPEREAPPVLRAQRQGGRARPTDEQRAGARPARGPLDVPQERAPEQRA